MHYIDKLIYNALKNENQYLRDANTIMKVEFIMWYDIEPSYEEIDEDVKKQLEDTYISKIEFIYYSTKCTLRPQDQHGDRFLCFIELSVFANEQWMKEHKHIMDFMKLMLQIIYDTITLEPGLCSYIKPAFPLFDIGDERIKYPIMQSLYDMKIISTDITSTLESYRNEKDECIGVVIQKGYTDRKNHRLSPRKVD